VNCFISLVSSYHLYRLLSAHIVLGVNDYNFAHLTLILLLHYLVKCRSRSLAIYNNEFILGCACIGSENHWDHKIIENLLLI